MDLIAPRRKTRSVRVGEAVIGSDHAILMLSTTHPMTSRCAAAFLSEPYCWNAGTEPRTESAADHRRDEHIDGLDDEPR